MKITGHADGRSGHQARRSACRENAEVLLEQVEGFSVDWIKGTKEAKEQGVNTYGRFWPRVQAVFKEKVRRMEHMKRGDELPSAACWKW